MGKAATILYSGSCQCRSVWACLAEAYSEGGSVTNLAQFSFLVDTKFVLHYSCVMKNVTITLDEEVARWARIRAAEGNTSLSRLVGEWLREKMREEENYRISMQRYLDRPPIVLREQGEEYPDREKLHDR